MTILSTIQTEFWKIPSEAAIDFAVDELRAGIGDQLFKLLCDCANESYSVGITSNVNVDRNAYIWEFTFRKKNETTISCCEYSFVLMRALFPIMRMIREKLQYVYKIVMISAIEFCDNDSVPNDTHTTECTFPEEENILKTRAFSLAVFRLPLDGGDGNTPCAPTPQPQIPVAPDGEVPLDDKIILHA